MGQRFDVDAALAPMVRHVRWVTAEQATRAQRYVRLPDGESELLVRVGAGRDATATVVGSRTMPLRKGPTQPVTTLLVRFRMAGAYPFFGVPMHALTDRLVPLGDLWHRDLVGSLGTATPRDAAAALLRALRTRIEGPARYEPSSVPYVRRALRVATAAPTLPTVRELAALLGGSERHLRRAFAEVVGIAPKPLLRIVRFQRALRWAEEARPGIDWSALAQRAGYCDQAHLIDDFRELGGATPTALFEGARLRRRAR